MKTRGHEYAHADRGVRYDASAASLGETRNGDELRHAGVRHFRLHVGEPRALEA